MGAGSIEAVTLDLWFTLIAHDKFYDDKITATRMKGVSKALQDAGYSVPEEKMAEAFYALGQVPRTILGDVPRHGH